MTRYAKTSAHGRLRITAPRKEPSLQTCHSSHLRLGASKGSAHSLLLLHARTSPARHGVGFLKWHQAREAEEAPFFHSLFSFPVFILLLATCTLHRPPHFSLRVQVPKPKVSTQHHKIAISNMEMYSRDVTTWDPGNAPDKLAWLQAWPSPASPQPASPPTSCDPRCGSHAAPNPATELGLVIFGFTGYCCCFG